MAISFLSNPASLHYSRFLINTGSHGYTDNVTTLASFFDSASECTEITAVRNFSGITYAQPNYTHYPVFGRSVDIPVSMGRQLPAVTLDCSLSSQFDSSSAISSITANSAPRWLAVVLLASKSSGYLLKTANYANMSLAIFYSYGWLLASGVSLPTNDSATISYTWQPKYDWVGPSKTFAS